jgi:hypothetical protein
MASVASNVKSELGSLTQRLASISAQLRILTTQRTELMQQIQAMLGGVAKQCVRGVPANVPQMVTDANGVEHVEQRRGVFSANLKPTAKKPSFNKQFIAAALRLYGEQRSIGGLPADDIANFLVELRSKPIPGAPPSIRVRLLEDATGTLDPNQVLDLGVAGMAM